MTYSLAAVAWNANHRFPPTRVTNVGTTVGVQDLTLSDANAPVGAQQNAMQTGTQILCQTPSGGQAWFVIDAERSIPGYPPIMRRAP
jgi:hypothetical protein